jgi:hypothetical protein
VQHMAFGGEQILGPQPSEMDERRLRRQ